MSDEYMDLLRPVSLVVQDYKVWATSKIARIPFGSPWLESVTHGGVAPGEVALLQARSSVGKTTIALNMVRANSGTPTVFFSLEMGARMLMARLAAMTSGLPIAEIEQQVRKTGNHPALQATIAAYPNLLIVDKPNLSLKEMTKCVEAATEYLQTKVQFVAIDYMELIGGNPGLNAVEQVDKTSRKVKDFARYHDVALLLLHQVGRGDNNVGSDPLTLGSGRYGGETAADYVVGAYRPCLKAGISAPDYQRLKNQIFFQLLKSRAGATAPVGELHRFDTDNLRIGGWAEYGVPLQFPPTGGVINTPAPIGAPGGYPQVMATTNGLGLAESDM
jgi:KaiC/GvpD/RAD55 family RecA-like ATPase